MGSYSKRLLDRKNDEARTMANEISVNPEMFIPDTSYSECCFPWDDVLACINSNENRAEKFKNSFPLKQVIEKHQSCPKCGVKSQNLYWIYFISPAWTWEKLCGRAGYLSICPACKIQVEFLTKVMN